MLKGCPYEDCNGPYVPDRVVNRRPRWRMRYPDSDGGVSYFKEAGLNKTGAIVCQSIN